MIETLTVITLCVLFLIFFRPGKTPPLKSPLVINRGGQFHAVLAPMLNLAQPLLESISRNMIEEDRQSGDTKPRLFRVTDKEVKAHGKDYYLLAMTLRDGMLYFQATAPVEGSNDLDTISTVSETELSRHPSTLTISETAELALDKAIQAAASQRGSSLAP
ncbi:MAG: hypothetical protein R8K20_01270, partial [Gallionellaceae bacterium]